MIDFQEKRLKPEMLKLETAENTTRYIVNKAAKMLVRNDGISEMQAFCRIQVRGYDQGISIRDAAQEILQNS